MAVARTSVRIDRPPVRWYILSNIGVIGRPAVGRVGRADERSRFRGVVVLLCGIATLYYYVVMLRWTATLYCYVVLLHCIATLYCYVVLLRCTTTCTVMWYCYVVLLHGICCVILLHSFCSFCSPRSLFLPAFFHHIVASPPVSSCPHIRA